MRGTTGRRNALPRRHFGKRYKRSVRSGIAVFFLTLLLLALLRVAMGFVGAPIALVGPLTILATIVFIAGPIFALYRAASHEWSVRMGLGFLVTGLLVHFGLFFLVRAGAFGTGIGAAVAGAISQQGLIVWCVGLGALLAALLKDKNLLIPVSFFLAGFDIFLVLTPIGPTQQILQKAPEVLPAVGLSIPKVQATPTMGQVAPFAFIGPADILFMAMFFIAIYKFNMRSRQTLIALVPAILVYLCLAFFLGPIPLLVPIGLTVLLVNAPEFKLNKEEIASTALVAAMVLGLIAWGATRPKPPAEPLPPGAVQEQQVPASSPAPAGSGPRP